MWVRCAIWLGAAVILAFGSVGCGSKPIEGPVTNESDLGAVCGGRYFAGAAPFAGSAPHPVVVFGPDSGNARTYAGPKRLPVFFLDRELGDVGPAWTTRDPTAIQLVACTERDDDSDSGQTCAFDGGRPTPLRFASYTVHVYETNTGVEIGTARIEAGEAGCPNSALVDENDPAVFSVPLPQQYLDALARFVNRP
jgi:hypothetical protein